MSSRLGTLLLSRGCERRGWQTAEHDMNSVAKVGTSHARPMACALCTALSTLFGSPYQCHA